MPEQRPLHKLFGLSWLDFFEGTSFAVEMEKDLSIKQQRLDLVIVRQGKEPLTRTPPDGFEDLATHNLVTFKSYQEPLDAEALQELIAHYVNYRKQVSPSFDAPLPAADFRLYAVCVRVPENLMKECPLQRLREGVYELNAVGLSIRIVVVHQLPQAQQNAMLQMFSVRQEQLRYGKEQWRPNSLQISTLLLKFWKAYREDPDMHAKLQEFYRETIEELLNELPPEELRKHLTPAERVEGLSSEELLKALSPEQLRAMKETIERQQTNGSSPSV